MSAALRITETAADFDRLPPHSIVAEQCLIASMMLDVAFIDEVVETLPSSEAFYLDDHKIIFDIIAALRAENRKIDAVIVREILAQRGLLEAIGGTAYLTEILNAVPSSANGPAYRDIVLDRFKLREIIAASNDALRAAYAPSADPDEISTSLAVKSECVRDTGGADPTVTLFQAVTDSVTAMRGGKPRRLLTRLDEGDPSFKYPESEVSFDYITGGFPFRQTTIVGGRPGSGKSAFVKSVLLRWARKGIPVGLVTIEEDRVKVGDNALAHESDVQNWKIQRSVVNDREYDTLKGVAEGVRDLPFYIDDTCTTLTQVENSLRRMVRKHGCQVLAVDHLHLIQHDSGRRNDTRNDQITVISGRIKALFRRLGVVGINVCQLNRSGEGIDNIPTMTTLREGGALEQDGDLIVFMHRRDYYRDIPNMSDGQPKDHKLEINVAKNKAGGTGPAIAYWNGDHQMVGNWNGGRGPMTEAAMQTEAQQALDYM